MAVIDGPAAPKVSQQDATWLKASIQTDIAEIQGGKLAERKRSNPAGVKLARALVADHTTLLKAADKLARHYGIDIPTSPSAKQLA